MKIARLTLYNFKCFEGEHVIDGLADDLTDEEPVILFGGLNGAGKTTFFEAILLCLYGKWNESVLWPSTGTKNETYINYIISVTNNRARTRIRSDMWIQIDIVEAEFGGVQHAMSIKRSWIVEKDQAEEVGVEITENGELINYVESEYEDFIRNELVPQEISQFFFFDGEKIQEFIKDEDKAFAESLESALGISLYKKLQKDLVTARRGILSDYNENEDYRIKLHDLNGKILQLEQEIRTYKEKIVQSRESVNEIDEEINDIEVETVRIANLDAQTKEEYEREKQSLDERKGVLQNDIYSAIEGQIPFIMMASLGQELQEQLDLEANYRQLQATYRASWAKIKPTVISVFFEGEEATPPLTSPQKKFYAEKLWHVLNTSVKKPPSDVTIIHDLTESQISEVTQRLSISRSILEQLTENLHELQNIEERRKQISSEEQKAMSNEAKRLYEERGRLLEEKKNFEGLIEQYKKNILDLEHEKENRNRDHTKLEKKAKKTDEMERQIQYCEKLGETIGVFAKQFKRRQVELLEQYTHEMWQKLARKQDLIARVEIDPDKRFAISLYDTDNILLDKTKLSAGEKELLAFSLIWALSRLTNRSLPIVIDTPFGRLDSDHRAHIAANYFPNASHQVILLSTDTEIIDKEYQALSPYVAKHYLIEKREGKSSRITAGQYFHVN